MSDLAYYRERMQDGGYTVLSVEDVERLATPLRRIAAARQPGVWEVPADLISQAKAALTLLGDTP